MILNELPLWRDDDATITLTPQQLAFILQAVELLALRYDTDDGTQAFIDELVGIVQAL